MDQFRKATGLIFAFIFAGTFAVAQIPHQGHHPPQNIRRYIQILESPSRDAWQQPQKVMAKLHLKPGDRIADVGSGPGYFTLRFARAVGPTGKVYAVDISGAMLDDLQRRAKADHLKNIHTILAKPHDPELPPESVNAIFICDTFHHISDRASYFPLLVRALKPRGRLIVVDFYKRPLPLGPPVHMKIPKAQMIHEAEAAGFHLVHQYNFLRYQYFLVFRK